MVRTPAAIVTMLLAACGSSSAPPVVAASAPAAGVYRYVVGGDSRDDHDHVIRWAFAEAKARGATAVLFLGDMELTPGLDGHFEKELPQLDPIPFYPLLGNHEVDRFGFIAIDKAAKLAKFRARFLGTARTPITSAIDGKVVYAVDLPGGLHYVALDNVSQNGFGREQLDWLARDLADAAANPAIRHIIVGMHKALAGNGVTHHSMDADGADAARDSAEALAQFRDHRVEIVFASHDHRYATFAQGGIPTYVTGGLGAPLDGSDAFHHFLQLDVSDAGLDVSIVKFSAAAAPD